MNPKKQYKLSPSDFGYLWNECKFCYVQKVKYGNVASSIFPAMFGRINNLLQTSIMGKNLQEVHPDLPSGIIEIQEGFLRSITIPGTDCFISGRFDILTKLDDGTYTIIDFKITTPDEEKLLKRYSSQLQAYKFALENPASGATPYKISKIGIVSVNPEEMKLENGKIVFTAVPRYHEVKDDQEGFFELVREVSGVLNGDMPEATATCGLCIYREKFQKSESGQADIPF